MLFRPGDNDAQPDALWQIVEDLFPICRSITGEGLRETLRYIRDRIDLDIREVPTGTHVFDWVIPEEWNIRDAFIRDASGKKVVDFQESNLHVVNYSEPVEGSFPLNELIDHLHTIPDQPQLVPYKTSYYNRTWGFCLSSDTLASMGDGEYDVQIDSTLGPGSLSYGELLVPGREEREILISVHCCHPSLANDNLSGIAVAAELARILQDADTRLSYRFLFVPGTIGSITWLATNQDLWSNIAGGFTLANLGDGGHFNYKKSRQGNSWIDRAVRRVFVETGVRYGIHEFSPYGYDERQYCSPGIDLPVGCLTRSVHGTYPEYHTSADNLDLVGRQELAGSLRLVLNIMEVLENDRRFVNKYPMGEPQLGKRGLYSTTGGHGGDDSGIRLAYLWVLNLSDGSHSLLDIARRSGTEFGTIVEAAERLHDAGLLEIAE